MAGETQTSTVSGELTQRFIEFVMMQAQNTALFLGQIPNPKTGQGEVNLELAKMFIDQLAMIQEKTRGNLTPEETAVLRNTLANLQMVYVEVSQHGPQAVQPAPPSGPSDSPSPEAASPPAAPEKSPEAEPTDGGESKKKFTKSYGS